MSVIFCSIFQKKQIHSRCKDTKNVRFFFVFTKKNAYLCIIIVYNLLLYAYN